MWLLPIIILFLIMLVKLKVLKQWQNERKKRLLEWVKRRPNAAFLHLPPTHPRLFQGPPVEIPHVDAAEPQPQDTLAPIPIPRDISPVAPPAAIDYRWEPSIPFWRLTPRITWAPRRPLRVRNNARLRWGALGGAVGFASLFAVLALWQWMPSKGGNVAGIDVEMASEAEPQINQPQPEIEPIEPNVNAAARSAPPASPTRPAPSTTTPTPSPSQTQPVAAASAAPDTASVVQQTAVEPSLSSAEPDTSELDSNGLRANGLRAGEPVSTNRGGISLPMVDPLELSGRIEIVGSASISPLIRQFYRRFILEGYRGVMNIRSVGIEQGFKLFCLNRKADIVLANRVMKAHEQLACKSKGLSPVELVIGADMLTIVTHIENDFVQNVSLSDLKKIFTANNWSQVNEDWPPEPIVRFVPAPATGTFDFFVDTIFRGDSEALMVAANTGWERDPEGIARSVGNEINSIGIVAYAFYNKYDSLIKKIAVNQVEPSPTLSAQDKYPLKRSLRIYSDTERIRNKPHVRAFLSFLLNHVSDEIKQSGYFPLSADKLTNSKLALLKAMGIEP